MEGGQKERRGRGQMAKNHDVGKMRKMCENQKDERLNAWLGELDDKK